MPGLRQRLEPLLIQALVAELAVEALDAGVLRRATRVVEQMAHAAAVCPGHEGAAGELWPLVGAHRGVVVHAIGVDGAVHQLDQVQRGRQPSDFKPMPTVGKGVEELRVWDDAATYRVIYLARMREAVYVLHAFQKKIMATSKQDIEIAKGRYAELMRGRK